MLARPPATSGPASLVYKPIFRACFRTVFIALASMPVDAFRLLLLALFFAALFAFLAIPHLPGVEGLRLPESQQTCERIASVVPNTTTL
jgi:hypothetical protein